MKQTPIFSLLGAASLVAASPPLDIEFVNPGEAHYFVGLPQFGNETANNLVEEASRNEEVSRSINFRPFVDDMIPQLTPEQYRRVEWTWHTNLTRVELRKDLQPDVVQRLVSTWYSLSWPGGEGNITAQLPEEDSPFCFRTPLIYRWPVNITNSIDQYDADDGSCVSALGEECVHAIIDLMRIRPGRNSQSSGGCGPLREWLYNLPECSGSFGQAEKEYRSGGGHASDRISMTGGWVEDLNTNDVMRTRTVVDTMRGGFPESNTSSTYRSWHPIFGANSDVYDDDDEDAESRWVNATNRLQMVMFQTPIPGTGGQNMSRKLLCTRVNASEWDPTAASGEDDSPAVRSAYAMNGFGWIVAAVAILGMGFL